MGSFTHLCMASDTHALLANVSHPVSRIRFQLRLAGHVIQAGKPLSDYVPPMFKVHHPTLTEVKLSISPVMERSLFANGTNR